MPYSSQDSIKFSAIPYVPLVPVDECDSALHGSEKVPANRVCIIWERGIHEELIIREIWTTCEKCIEKCHLNQDIARADNVRMVVK